MPKRSYRFLSAYKAPHITPNQINSVKMETCSHAYANDQEVAFIPKFWSLIGRHRELP